MKDSKVIVCAGGKDARWRHPIIRNKHMIPAYGEPLVRRAQRLALEAGFTNVHLACDTENIDAYLVDGAKLIDSPARHANDIRCHSVVWHLDVAL